MTWLSVKGAFWTKIKNSNISRKKNEGNSKFKYSNLKFAHVLFTSTNNLSVAVYLEQNKKQGTLLLNNNLTLNIPTIIRVSRSKGIYGFVWNTKEKKTTYLLSSFGFRLNFFEINYKLKKLILTITVAKLNLSNQKRRTLEAE